ncbi:MAG TPA: hypothetical protein VK369_05590 [Segetibacter sp.]|nr:hypothetical protein [Segetibacter sp.]
MKKLILPLFASITFAANAQFSIQPQLGMETSRTTIQSSDFSAFSPADVQVAPRLGVRMAYKVKTGHGAFLGFATGNSAVKFKFTDPQSARSSYTTLIKGLQFRLESGYEFTTKPIAIGKQAISNGDAKKYGQKYAGGEQHKRSGYTRCGMRNSTNHYGKSSYKTKAQNKGLFMRIKPSVGLALAPSGSGIATETKAGQTNYEFKTGWNTALIAGTAFDFGTRSQSKFVVSVNYLKSLGNKTQTLYTGPAKTIASTFGSATSGFNVSIGIPINFTKKSTITQPRQYQRPSYRGHCGRYKMYYQ